MIRFLLGVLIGVIIGASIATRLPNIEFDYFERKADEIIEEKIQQQTDDIKEQIKSEREESKKTLRDFLENI
ncbi:YtxH domain-containing protein [Methylophilaceae bacterium]|jgi:gas vesicle protein|nr:YtxH domain-containing protein [Methylophilaceae bacterium]MDB4138786.1 YtxH domain-containing protein [Methylophilaceae bacterium]|tara:strand:- start:79 stop:294 length:216 start_codon:yes stop_codon:yes gene_type:complete